MTEFVPWDLVDQFGDPAAAGEATYEACLAADLTPGSCSSPEPRFHARNCGDGPFQCKSGYVFHRAASQVRVTADPDGDADEVFIVYDATVPGTETDTGTTFGTVDFGVGSQGAIYFTKTTDGGRSWSEPERIHEQEKGHQFFPDIDAEEGGLHAVWQDSRNDCASGPPTTPSGGDFRTVPFSNEWVPDNPPGAVSCGPALVSVYATSSDGGESWSTQIVSEAMTMPQHEQFGFRDLPFFGDYNYVAASGSTVLMDWTDHRDVVPGTDPRYTNGDGADGFDVLNCIDPETAEDPCANDGGLDQNIYGFVIE